MKKLLGIYLTAVLAVALSTVAFATGGTCPGCGEIHSYDSDGDGTLDTAISGSWTALDSNFAASALGEGNYYLTGNIETTSTITVTGTVNLCLNGYSISAKSDNHRMFYVNSGVSFNLYDCAGNTGKITGAILEANGAGVYVNGGTFNMYGGTITGNTATNGSGGGVYLASGSEFNMYDGMISGNTATDGGAVYVYNSGTSFNMFGGTITGHTTSSVHVSGGTFNMSGAAVIQNNSSGVGAGVYIEGGSFTMSDTAVIQNNTTTGTGGAGVYLYGGTFTMSGGTITGNDGAGGGGVRIGNSGVMTMTGGSITGNTASSGKGVYIHTGTLKVEDSPVIDGVYLMNGTISVTDDLTATARIGIECEAGDTVGTVGGSYDVINSNFYVVGHDDIAASYSDGATLTDVIVSGSDLYVGDFIYKTNVDVVSGSSVSTADGIWFEALTTSTTVQGITNYPSGAGDNGKYAGFYILSSDYTNGLTTNGDLYLYLNGKTMSGAITATNDTLYISGGTLSSAVTAHTLWLLSGTLNWNGGTIGTLVVSEGSTTNLSHYLTTASKIQISGVDTLTEAVKFITFATGGGCDSSTFTLVDSYGTTLTSIIIQSGSDLYFAPVLSAAIAWTGTGQYDSKNSATVTLSNMDLGSDVFVETATIYAKDKNNSAVKVGEITLVNGKTVYTDVEIDLTSTTIALDALSVELYVEFTLESGISTSASTTMSSETLALSKNTVSFTVTGTEKVYTGDNKAVTITGTGSSLTASDFAITYYLMTGGGVSGTATTPKDAGTYQYVISGATSSNFDDTYYDLGTSKTGTLTITAVAAAGSIDLTITDTDSDQAIGVNDVLAMTYTPTLTGETPSYQWYCNNGEIVGETSASCTLPASTAGDTYYCIVTLSGNTTGAFTSETVTFGTSAPIFTTISTAYGDGYVTLNWTVDNGGNPITGYTLSATYLVGGVVTNVDGALLTAIALDATSHTVSGLTNGTEYTFVLTATNAVGSTNSVELKATPYKSSSSSGGSSVTYYTSTLEETVNGEASLSATSATSGKTITITTTPDEGYAVESVSVVKSTGTSVTVTDNGDGTYSYAQPSSKATVTVSFVVVDESDHSFFTDVDEDDWYYEAVEWAVENDITSGTTATTFNPNGTCTRAQAVTFLWRAAGEPVVDYINPFTDVATDSYYYEAVLWAVSEGITVGTSDTTFSPNVDCTRGHIVTFLYRAAEEPEVTDDCDFSDVSATAYYYNAVLWAVENGITNGTTDTTFSPSNNCTRAHIVTFLYRWLGM